MVQEKVVVVGTGEYGEQFLAPTLALLEQEERAKVLVTVDIVARSANSSYTVEHRKRHTDQDLPSLLSDLQDENPIVILGHSNEYHVPDMRDLRAEGYRVMMEKPFALSSEEITHCREHLAVPQHVAFLEYYLMMKAAPLLIAAGLIDPLSFYAEKAGIIETKGVLQGQGWRNIHGKLERIIGKPHAVFLDILEGEKKERGTGRLDHRGPHIIDTRKGGGMLHDLGVHGFSILFGLEHYLGKIDPTFLKGDIRVARAEEYLTFARDIHHIPDKFIGESYAELHFQTETHVPVSARFGKYVLDNTNQRRLIIVGDRGVAYQDLSSCELSIIQGEKALGALLEAPKLPQSKYYPVIRSGLELLQQHSPYHGLDANTSVLLAQELVLSALGKVYRSLEMIKTYSNSAANPASIFS